MAGNTSTTLQGNAFRDAIMRLIRLRPNCREVQAERKVGSQPVDLYYEERTSFGTLRIACECKDYKDPLTKTYIAEKIASRYQPLVDRGHVDRVRIIAPKPIGPTADEYLRTDLRGFSFSTRSQLEAEIIDFGPYVQAIESLYRESNLDKYYIKPATQDGEDLETRVLQWIDSESSQPTAILGGYGMGKTSFARRLAHIAARNFQKDSRARIPILISLYEISSEQRIDGLVARLLTNEGLVSNYSWPLFSELNSLGRLLIILDGFDEMKHTMTWVQFKHNFSQLNKLVVPHSKVLLLGRPSAFASDDEHVYILSGKKRIQGGYGRVPDAPIYVELNLREFSRDQALDFLRRYIAIQGPAMATLRGESYDAQMLQGRLEHIAADTELMSLIQRPVQAKMVADLAMDPNVEWRSFSRYELYAEFLERIIQREVEKPTRSAYTADERMSFHRILAWFLWTRAKGSGFKLVDLPQHFLAGFLKEEVDDVDELAIARDLISGSLLERKSGDAYFFPHRSFVEFLVADLVCSEQMDSDKLMEVSSSLNQEVVEFIKESRKTASVAEWANLIDQVKGAISIQLLSVIAWAKNYHDEDTPQPSSRANPHDIMISHMRLMQSGASASDIANFLGRSFHSGSNDDTRVSCIRGLIWVANGAKEELKRTIWSQIAALVLVSCLDEFKRILSGSQVRVGVALEVRFPLVRAFAESFARDSERNGEMAVRIDAATFARWIHRELGYTWEVASLDLGHAGESFVVGLSDLGVLHKRLKLSEEGRTVISFLRAFPNPKALVGVHHKSVGRVRTREGRMKS